MDAVLWFHQNWFFGAVVTTGVVGVWGVGLALFRRPPAKAFGIAVAIAISAMLIQVAAGVTLYLMGMRQPQTLVMWLPIETRF